MNPIDPLIDPKLMDVLKQWHCFTQQNSENLKLVFSAFTPVQDSLQVTQQVLQRLQNKPFAVEQSAVPSEAVSNAYRELIDIQQAAFKKEQEVYFRYWSIGLNNGKQMMSALQGVSSPQQALAAYLEANLDLARQYQDNFSEQLSDLNQIKAAYSAWWQKTLEAVSAQSTT